MKAIIKNLLTGCVAGIVIECKSVVYVVLLCLMYSASLDFFGESVVFLAIYVIIGLLTWFGILFFAAQNSKKIASGYAELFGHITGLVVFWCFVFFGISIFLKFGDLHLEMYIGIPLAIISLIYACALIAYRWKAGPLSRPLCSSTL